MNSVLPTTEKDRRRFWAFVDRRDGECWLWKGCVVPPYGRARFQLRGKSVSASRAAWAIANGREPDGFVCHTCDNPSCVNPAHLWIGNNQQNMADCRRKGRHHNASKTHCFRGHEFTPENTRMTKGGSRSCRVCEAIYREEVRGAQ